ncbi:MAG: UvrD-helicase domain-containing protein [Acidobacteria bacterium]|nr:UvrD-helicase domain-containing protein [Acidobacteriota bacterium]
MKWTAAQREAIDTRGRRVLVSAGAGSGKTRVLVERFLKLLEENPDWQVADIVAVTFTEKAAREMVARIRREIRSRIEQSLDPDERRRWREHRNALDSSRIGTIHALCASLLRAHPAEAALDPEFEVSEEIEAAVLLDTAIEETLVETARLQAPELEIFSYLTAHQIRSTLRALIAQGESGRRALSRFLREESTPQDAAEILTFWRNTLTSYQIEAANLLLERSAWHSEVATITTLVALKSDDKREQCRLQVVELLEVAAFSDDDERIKALREIAHCINLRGGSIRNWASADEFEAVKIALNNLRQFIRDEKVLELEVNEADAQAAEVVAYLARLYDKTRARFQQMKNARAVLDFNDLEEITEAMLAAHPEVCQLYQGGERLRALMIDEFQDTSPIQKSILWKLAPANQELFIIGDAKQSIYRFRGADVTVFQDARHEVESSGGCVVGMDTCFRTHSRLIGFVNHLFPAVFTVESRYDTPYEKMLANRAALHEQASVELHIIAQNPNAEADEASATEAPEKLNAMQLRDLEARLMARRINEIIHQGEVLVGDERNAPRRAAYGDFALLFQASTHFDIYEQALADAEIPYVTIAGRGFYARQEITDISNLLAFLASPIDNLSLASVLRSPMFAWSDETLLRLRLEPIAHLWTALGDDSITVAPDQLAAVEFARATLTHLRTLVGRVSAAQLLTTAVRETGYLATLMALPNGERRVANVEKLIEQTHQLATLTLAEVVERIQDLRFREIREGEATIEEAGAVRLMTVHKSKGLEFPIVWIVDATYGGNTGKSLLAMHSDFGIALDVRADDFDRRKETPRSAAFDLLRRLEAQMDKAEKKRLLYVAATRARDHLMISGSLGRAKLTGEHWLGRLARALGFDEESRPNQVEYGGSKVDVYWHEAQAFEDARERVTAERQVEDLSPMDAADFRADIFRAFPLLRRLST